MFHFYIQTFGCQMNINDSERIRAFLEKYQGTFTNNLVEADLIIFNTCGVRQSAEDRVYGQVFNLRRQNLSALIVITGCVAHRTDVQKRLKNKIDLAVNIRDFFKEILPLLQKFNPSIPLEIESNSTQDYLKIIPRYSNSFSAYIPIMTGCNNFCSYCVVPYARGREYSRPTPEILEEIRNLISKGYKEIFLLGQNVNSYYDQENKIDFAQLLEKINNLAGNFWIRFLSSHPKDMNDKLIEAIARLEKVCEYVHLPIQAGDDQVLKKMNRRYTRQDYLRLIEKIKKAFQKYKPHQFYALTTDIIVGFPGESEEQFQKSLEVMQKVKYDMAYTARFSPRPETIAWNFTDNVSPQEKREREKRLVEALKKTALEKNQQYINQTLTILVDKIDNGFIYGKTRTLKNVRVPLPPQQTIQEGDFLKVKIIRAKTWSLEGEIKI